MSDVTIVETINQVTVSTVVNTATVVTPGPQGAPGVFENLISYGRNGDLEALTGTMRYWFPFNATILGVSAAVNTAPQGTTPIRIDVHLNNSTIFPDVNHQPLIQPNAYASGEVTNLDVSSITTGDYLTVNIDTVGDIVAGADLTVFIRYQKA